MPLPDTHDFEAALAGLSLQKPAEEAQPLFLDFIPKSGPVDAVARPRKLPEVFFASSQEQLMKGVIKRVEAELVG